MKAELLLPQEEEGVVVFMATASTGVIICPYFNVA